MSSLTRRISQTSNHLRNVSSRLSQVVLKWDSDWSCILIVHKKLDPGLVEVVKEVIKALYNTKSKKKFRKVLVDGTLEKDKSFREFSDSIEQSQFFSQSPSPSSETSTSKSCAFQINFWREEEISMMGESLVLDNIDLVITLGGDGTVLYASWLFQSFVPPLLTVHLGSLGFLTTHQPKSMICKGNDDYYESSISTATPISEEISAKSPVIPENSSISPAVAPNIAPTIGTCSGAFDFIPSIIQNIKSDGVKMHVRMRFRCSVFRWCSSIAAAGPFTTTSAPSSNTPHSELEPSPGIRWCELGPLPLENASTPTLTPVSNDKVGMFKLEGTFHILNDLVIDRGPSPYMSVLELFGDSRHMTTVQADGLVVSTPTGSTAYNLSAGGSLVHPLVPALLITPICPHTLSFRPMLLPDSMTVKICVPSDSRNTAWASFDGRHRIELKQGDYISISASEYPVPTICRSDCTGDWFESLTRCLHWNERQSQKPFAHPSHNHQ